jgi:hypothetical protein
LAAAKEAADRASGGMAAPAVQAYLEALTVAGLLDLLRAKAPGAAVTEETGRVVVTLDPAAVSPPNG